MKKGAGISDKESDHGCSCGSTGNSRTAVKLCNDCRFAEFCHTAGRCRQYSQCDRTCRGNPRSCLVIISVQRSQHCLLPLDSQKCKREQQLRRKQLSISHLTSLRLKRKEACKGRFEDSRSRIVKRSLLCYNLG